MFSPYLQCRLLTISVGPLFYYLLPLYLSFVYTCLFIYRLCIHHVLFCSFFPMCSQKSRCFLWLLIFVFSYYKLHVPLKHCAYWSHCFPCMLYGSSSAAYLASSKLFRRRHTRKYITKFSFQVYALLHGKSLLSDICTFVYFGSFLAEDLLNNVLSKGF